MWTKPNDFRFHSCDLPQQLHPPSPHPRRSNKVDRRKKFKKRSRDSSGKPIGLPLPLVTGQFNPLNAELNPICYLLALLGAHHFLHVSRIRVKITCSFRYGRHICFLRIRVIFAIHMSVHHNIIPNYSQRDATFLDLFIFTDALHVSGGSSAHYQEHTRDGNSSISFTVAASSIID